VNALKQLPLPASQYTTIHSYHLRPNKVILFGATFMREQGDFTTAQSDFNAARGDSESPTRAVLGAELARRGRVLSERGKVGKGAERKVKNHFIDHSYHFIPNALIPRTVSPRLPFLRYPCTAPICRRTATLGGWTAF
jgi:hypothetical protein